MQNEVVKFNGFVYLLIFVVLETEVKALCTASNVKESTPGPLLKVCGSHKID